MNYDEKLSQLREKLDNAKNLKYKSEARLEQLNSQKEDLTEQIRSFGIEPEELDDKLNSLQAEIESLLKQAEELMPED